MKNFIILLIIFSSIKMWAQAEDCKKPLDRNWATAPLKVYATDLSKLANDGEKINYSYTIQVDDVSYFMSNKNPQFYKNSKLILAKIDQDNQENGVDVKVKLRVELYPKGVNFQPQIFESEKNYKVKTAGLCLEEMPFELSMVKIKLPEIKIFNSYFNLFVESKYPTNESRYRVKFELDKVLDQKNNELSFRLINPTESGNLIEISAYDSNNSTDSTKKAKISLDISNLDIAKIILTKEDFLSN